jgi:tetratricopeptide (TPR) repeat protein
MLLGGCSSTPTVKVEQAEQKAETSAALPDDYDKALVLMQAGDYQAALPVLRQFIDSNPELAGPYINLGIACQHTGQDEAAMEALRRAVELNPANAAAHHQLGILYREQGQFDAALQAYNRALKLDAGYALAHRNIGILYDLYLGQPALALEHYRKYLELAPDPDPSVDRWVVDLARRTGPTQARTEQ